MILKSVCLLVPLMCAACCTECHSSAPKKPVPPSWEVLPVPRCADYGSPKQFVTVSSVAIVRRDGGPYQTVRDRNGELAAQSTIVEEELTGILRKVGVARVESVSDDMQSYEGFDTLVLLGSPERNTQTAKAFADMRLTFRRWNDPNTPEDDFTDWADLGREGYVLKVGRAGGKNVVILAGYDYDDAKRQFWGAGTFYALQSLRQLICADGKSVRIKTAEIADKPLVSFRGCFTAFDPNVDMQWRDVANIAEMKCNANIYWYGNGMGGYNVEAASKFRYPWKPDQLELYGKIGKWCREHFIMMVFCMNADHYNYEWAAPKTFDGKERDPAHYDLKHEVEPPFKEMWSKLGYEVHNDIDILAAKFSQLNKAVGGGAMFQAMNEDDVFGLIHPDDKKLYGADTDDKRHNAIAYGKARGEFLGSLYKRIREIVPDSCDLMTFDPPGALPYQTVLETNEYNSRDFLESMGATMKKMGVLDHTPILTTGGGTLAEVVSTKQLDDFSRWSAGAPILLHENNFVLSRVGAYETDPNGPRWPLQKSKTYPAGFRDKQLYKHLWGIQWNGMADVARVLGWSQASFMWNMLAADREKLNALAVRKVTTAKSYPLVKTFFEDFDRPIAYLPDDGGDQIAVISDEIAFPGKGWEYVITYSDEMRLKAQRLRAKLGDLIPRLQATWEDPVVRGASLKHPGWDAYNFCSVYLARGYIKGWEGSAAKPREMLSGTRLRDLLLEAEDIQQRYFAGPDEIPGRSTIDRNYYSGSFNRLYVQRLKQPAKTPAESPFYVDIWNDGLLARFFEPVSSTVLADIPDNDPRLISGWGEVEEADGDRFRIAASEATARTDAPASGQLLVRVRVGTGAAALTESVNVSLSTPGASHDDAVCKPRWISWLLPEGKGASSVTIRADKPVRVYEIAVFRHLAK